MLENNIAVRFTTKYCLELCTVVEDCTQFTLILDCLPVFFLCFCYIISLIIFCFYFCHSFPALFGNLNNFKLETSFSASPEFCERLLVCSKSHLAYQIRADQCIPPYKQFFFRINIEARSKVSIALQFWIEADFCTLGNLCLIVFPVISKLKFWEKREQATIANCSNIFLMEVRKMVLHQPEISSIELAAIL